MDPLDREAAELLDFWIGALDQDGLTTPEKSARWFKKDQAFDDELRLRYLHLHRAVAGRQREAWRETARGRLAYVIVLDQLSRNMFRGSPEMFAHDAQALDAVREGIARGHDRALAVAERSMFYLPFMHSEELSVQDEGLKLCEAWRDELSGSARARVQQGVQYAVAHREIIGRFGRFPHRNAVLGRESSEEEREFLKQPGSSF